MSNQKSIMEICEEKARKGDAQFAIAYAILDLSETLVGTNQVLNRLGNGNASTDLGAIEGLGMQIEKAARIIAENLD